MPSEVKRVGQALRGCRILIVEDGAALASHIHALVERHTGVEPAVAHSMEEAHEKVADEEEGFDLAIVDVMLPRTREDFKEIQAQERVLAATRERIREIDPSSRDEEERMALVEARYERSRALERIDALIDREGGIGLVEEWRGGEQGQRQAFPILFLTAVGDDEKARRGRSAAGGRADWLVKPAPGDRILEKCANLLLQDETEGERP